MKPADPTKTVSDLEFVDTIAAFTLLLNILCRKLDDSGALAKADIALMLRRLPDFVRKIDVGHPHGDQRLDFQIFQKLADFLEDDASPIGWMPTVIKGGKI